MAVLEVTSNHLEKGDERAGELNNLLWALSRCLR